MTIIYQVQQSAHQPAPQQFICKALTMLSLHRSTKMISISIQDRQPKHLPNRYTLKCYISTVAMFILRWDCGVKILSIMEHRVNGAYGSLPVVHFKDVPYE